MHIADVHDAFSSRTVHLFSLADPKDPDDMLIRLYSRHQERLRGINDSVTTLLYRILVHVTGTGMITVFMFLLGIAADIDPNNGLLRYIARISPFQPTFWQYSFIFASLIIALIRPKIGVFSTILISPFFLLLYYLFRAFVFNESGGGPPSLFFLILVTFLMVLTIVFYLRSVVIIKMSEIITTQELELMRYRAPLEGIENAESD